MSCSFCSLDASRKWIDNEYSIAFPDAYPVSDGHTLVIPRKHVSSIYELAADEQSAVWALVAEVRERLLNGLKPDALYPRERRPCCWADCRARSCACHPPAQGRCARSTRWRPMGDCR